MKIDKTYKAKSVSYSSIPRNTKSIKYIIIHYTGNSNDKAINNAKYFATSNTRAAGAHYFVDETSIYQSIPDNRTAWAVGGKKLSDKGYMHGKITNSNSISIEMCDSVKDVPIQTRINTVALTCYLMHKYGISINNVYRHHDVTGKICPASLVDRDKWIAFRQYIRIAYDMGVNLRCTQACTAKEMLRLRSKSGELQLCVPSGTEVLLIQKNKCKMKLGSKTYKMSKVSYEDTDYYVRTSALKF